MTHHGSHGSRKRPNRREGARPLAERTSRTGADVARNGSGPGRQGSLFGDQLPSFQKPKGAHERIGVVDVGSNSVRMVIFEGGRRCPAMVFNEKVLCGLGAELAQTGRLSPDGIERAIRALKRFVALAPGLNVGALAGVATAAVREAEDGPDFVERVRRETNIRLDVASGQDEARLAAQGVLFGDPAARGLVIDLGGASLELCPIRAGKPGKGVTTPLGPQRLGDITDRAAARRSIAETLAPHVARYRPAGQHLFLVGGAWRALGRVQIERAEHPMSVLHEYTFSPAAAVTCADFILGADPDDLASIPGVPSGRVGTLPHAALLLQELIATFEPENISISGFGLREGICFECLPDAVSGQDPLLSTCEGQEFTRARAPGFGRELGRWLRGALPAHDEAEKRLIRAASHLVDVSWRAHPDYRATACLEVVTRVNVSGAGHRGRAYIAAMLLNRYKGGKKAMAGAPEMALLSEEEITRAAALGALMRLACTISGATPGYLPLCPVTLEEDRLCLKASRSSRVFLGEEVEKRLAQAARALDVGWEIVA